MKVIQTEDQHGEGDKLGLIEVIWTILCQECTVCSQPWLLSESIMLGKLYYDHKVELMSLMGNTSLSDQTIITSLGFP